MKIKNWIYFASLLALALFFYWQDSGSNDLLKAFRNGNLRLILTAKDGGKTVDLTVEQVGKTAKPVIIKKGKTPIEIYGHGRILLICDKERKIPFSRSAADTLNLPIEQENGVPWTSGTVILGPVINLRK